MKNNNLFLIAVIGFLILTNYPIFIFGQSGRQQKSLEPTPTPVSRQTQPTHQSKTQPGIIDDGQQKSRYKFVIAQNLESFLEQLNDAGARGYKFAGAVKVDGSQIADFRETKLFAIMKYDSEAPYEYGWFESFNTFHFHSDNLPENQDAAAKQAFYFVKRIEFVEFGCETSDLAPTDDRKNWTPFRQGSIYLFERQKGLKN